MATHDTTYKQPKERRKEIKGPMFQEALDFIEYTNGKEIIQRGRILISLSLIKQAQGMIDCLIYILF